MENIGSRSTMSDVIYNAEGKNGQRVVTAGRLHWEIITVCFYGKAVLLLPNYILFHVFSYCHMYVCIYFMGKGIIMRHLYGFSNLLVYTKDTKMREVTTEELFGFQFFSSCFVKTVMQHLQSSSAQNNKAYLDIKSHIFKRNSVVKLRSVIFNPVQRKSHKV